VNDRLIRIIDAMTGPVDYTHDAFGNLSAAAYADGRVDLRMPDAVGNLFRTTDRGDRKYGPAGQLLEARDSRGVTTYDYDPEGNLTKKVEPDGATWTYAWNGAGMLVRVVRPNGHAVEFTYDALARRLSKSYRGKTTRWIWDGNVPLHEWVERAPDAVDEDFASREREEDSVAANERALKAMLAGRPANGPPAAEAESIKAAANGGTADAPVTWVFEPESFAPLAKLVGGETYGIVTDHLGTPEGMFDGRGVEVWGADIDAYGDLRNVRGERGACPFRWPGQYEDGETGFYYNRFRYYDCLLASFVSQDPARIQAGIRPYSYAANPLRVGDPLGLAETVLSSGTVYRGGSNTPANMTPRPGKDTTGPKRGLSTFQDLEQAARPGEKAQAIDVEKLGPDLEAVLNDENGHVSIRPKDDPSGAKLESWADQRGAENPLASQVQQARTGEVRAPQCK
jgi:RHS repeat-associated protein